LLVVADEETEVSAVSAFKFDFVVMGPSSQSLIGNAIEVLGFFGSDI